jgi:hypothetical protein
MNVGRFAAQQAHLVHAHAQGHGNGRERGRRNFAGNGAGQPFGHALQGVRQVSFFSGADFRGGSVVGVAGPEAQGGFRNAGRKGGAGQIAAIGLKHRQCRSPLLVAVPAPIRHGAPQDGPHPARRRVGQRAPPLRLPYPF